MSSETFLQSTGFDLDGVLAEAAESAARRAPRAKQVHGPYQCPPGESLLELAFEEAGMLGPVGSDGKRSVRCPWESTHTAGTTFDTSTVLFPATEGSDLGFFHCSHGHCDGRELDDVLSALPKDAVDRAYARHLTKRQVRHDADLVRYALSTSPTQVTPANAAPPVHVAGTDERYTDVGNAKRLVARFGGDLRFMYLRANWLAWDGKRWSWDEHGHVELCAKLTIAELFRDAANMGVSAEAERKALVSHAMVSESAPRVRAMVQLARSEPGMSVVPGELDADDWALNVDNGTLDLKTGALRPHDRKALHTKLAPVAFDPAAKAPLWEAFVHHIFGGDVDLISFVQRVCGYALTGSVSAQILVFFYGTGSNGKTTFLETLGDLLGDYSGQAAPGLLLEKKNDSHPTEIADLVGRRLVVSTEVEQGRKLSEALVKQLTGGDKLKARYMRQDFFEFRPTHKLFLMANHKPIVHGNDVGIWRRIVVIPFTVVIPKKQRDLDLRIKLGAERSGILNWLLKGCADWQRSGLDTSPAVEAATAAYREEMDRLGGFLQGRCVLGSFTAKAADLYSAYVAWCVRDNDTPVSQRTFGMMLGERGFQQAKVHGLSAWKGLRPMTPKELAEEFQQGDGGGWGVDSGWGP